MRNLRVSEVQCRTILNKSVMGFADYTLNAYQGCAFGCSYCYVPAMRVRRGQIDSEKWGAWVEVKVNAADVLRRQMLRVEPEARIAIGTASDSWQSLEKRYSISRAILKELSYYPNPVHIVTRSPLLIRDIDVLQSMEQVRIGISLPSFDERVRRTFEPEAPAFAGRVELIRRLVAAGLRVSLFWAPILPGVADNADAVEEYVRRAAELGVQRIVWSGLNYTDMVAKPHMQLLQVHRAESEGPVPRSLPRAELAREIERCAKMFGIRCS